MILVLARFALGREGLRRFRSESESATAALRDRFRTPAWSLLDIQPDESTYTVLVVFAARGWDSIGPLVGQLHDFPGRLVEVHSMATPEPEVDTDLLLHYRSAFRDYWSAFPAEGDRCPECGVPEPPHMPWCPRFGP
jgi:hypothetical protein